MTDNTTAPGGDEHIDDILHDFAVAESLSETQLGDKLKRKVITADEYDDRLVENYRENKAKAKAYLDAYILAEVQKLKPRKQELVLRQTKLTDYQLGYNEAVKDFDAAIARFGKGGNRG